MMATKKVKAARTKAAKKGWVTRRAKATARSKAAKKGWATRRAKATARSKAAKKSWATRRAKKTETLSYLRALLRSLPQDAQCAVVAKNGADLTKFGYAGSPNQLEEILDSWVEKYGDTEEENYIENWMGGIKVFAF